jgi:ketopantoate reductase
MIRSVAAVLVMVPMRRALGTSAMGIPEAPLVLIDLHTDERLAFTDTVPASMTSSMHHDLEQGNRLEVAWHQCHGHPRSAARAH